ncbi:MAG TPA: hypothetical protein VNR40_14340 [Steroidobacter sp.]|nr:hypothetical protein [Steroidobacter sp.]
MDALTRVHPRTLWLVVRWETRRRLRRLLDIIGVVNLSLLGGLVLALALGVTAFQLDHSAAALHERAATLRIESASRPAPVVTLAGGDVLIQEHYARLPAHDQLPHLVQRLLKLGRAHDLVLGEGEYRIHNDTNARTSSYRIRLPVSGNGEAIQRFVLEAMNDQPTLALQSLAMRRERIGTGAVEADIQFVLFVKPATVVDKRGAT